MRITIDFDKESRRLSENNEIVTTDKIVYESIFREINNHYKIGGIKIYFYCSKESSKEDFFDKIVSYVSSLETEDFDFVAYDKCKPKITHDGKFFASLSTIIQPERSKREDSQKCEMRCSEHCGNTVRKVQ